MKKHIPVILLIIAIFISLCGSKTYAKTSEWLLYKNHKLGFTLRFPISWKGYYVVKDRESDFIEICFIGKSKRSKNISGENNQVNGLSMFFIGTEECVKEDEFIDSVKKIGRARRTNYYYFTSTDYPLGALFDDANTDIKDKKERELIKKDYLKAQQMEKDVEKILKTFKAIK